MTANYQIPDPIFGLRDLDDEFITNSWLIDQYVGSALLTCGYDNYGGLGNGSTNNASSPVQVGTLTTWKQISSGGNFAAGIKLDGTLWTWGYNAYGTLGNGNAVSYSSPIQVGSLTTWKQVDCNLNHVAAIKTDGTLWAWGENIRGQLGNGFSGASLYYSSPVQVGSLTNWKQVACGYYHTAAIRNNGTLWTWGSNTHTSGTIDGQLGNGSSSYYSSPIQIGALTTWQQVTCGSRSTMAVKTDGTLWGCGYNGYGGLGNGTVLNYSSPIQVGALTNWKQISQGYGVTSAIKTDGTLWACGGTATYGEIGNGTSSSYSSPIQIGALTNWKQVSCGGYHVAATRTDGTLWAWGRDTYGELGVGNSTNYSSPVQVGSLTNWKIVSCRGSATYMLQVSNVLSTATTAQNTSFQITDSNTNNTEDLGNRYVSKAYLSAIYGNLASGQVASELWSWGTNQYGQLGNSTSTGYSSPVQVGSLTNWLQVATGQYFTVALKNDGTVWCCGNNAGGQTGNGTVNVYYSSPVQVGSLTTWQQVAAGSVTSYAIKNDGTLWGWGSGSSGALGNNAQVNYSSPIQVGSLTNWRQISGGANFAMGILNSGQLWALGFNSSGQLGIGSTTQQLTPVQVTGSINWSQVSAGYNSTAAVRTDGTLWVWGSDAYGQLGNGTILSYSSPIQVGTLTNWKQVSAGYGHIMAIKTDGTLWAWGENTNGQLGNGNALNYSSPIQVGTLTNWKWVSSCKTSTFAIKTDGTLWSCGYNSGLLGNGNNTNYSSPVQIGSLTTWKQVSSGGISYEVLAINDGYN